VKILETTPATPAKTPFSHATPQTGLKTLAKTVNIDATQNYLGNIRFFVEISGGGIQR
jgi:hypothetical protein